jgi:hypothetical protein
LRRRIADTGCIDSWLDVDGRHQVAQLLKKKRRGYLDFPVGPWRSRP